MAIFPTQPELHKIGGGNCHECPLTFCQVVSFPGRDYPSTNEKTEKTEKIEKTENTENIEKSENTENTDGQYSPLKEMPLTAVSTGSLCMN